MKVATAGLAALAVGAAYAFKKFEESENVMQQTDAVLKSTGHAANVTAKQVDQLATALSEKSGVDDEVIASGENMLLTFKNIRNEVGAGNDIFNQATTATLDMAAGMAAASGGTIDMKAASIQLGKALNDPVAGLTSLSRVGVQFTEQQTRQIEKLVEQNDLLGAQKIILQEVTSQFQGSAEAQKTTAGEVSVAFENLAETVGEVLAPAIRTMADALTTAITWMQEHVPPAWEAFKTGVENAWNAVQPFVDTLSDQLIPLFETAWDTLKDKLLPALERLKPLFVAIGTAVVAMVLIFTVQLALVVTAVGYVVDAFLDFVGFVRDKIVEPVVNFLGRIVEFVRGKLEPIWDTVKSAAVSAFNAILGPIQAVIDKIETLIGWIQDAIGWLQELFSEGGAGAQTGALTGRPSLPGVQVPGVQSGGFVARSGVAVIHKGENIIPSGGGGDVVLQIDGQTFARISRDQLLKLKGSRVNLGLS